MDLFANNFIAVDFETATASRMICQIGVAVVENGVIVEKISEYVQPPENYYEANCIRIHHIRPHTTAYSPTFDQIWPRLKKYFCNNVVVSHSNFDEDALLKNLSYYGLSTEEIPRFKDTSIIFGRKYKLIELCVGLEIPVSNHHDACADAVMCANVYLHYLAGVMPNVRRIIEFKKISEKRKPSFKPHTLDIEHFEEQHLRFYQMINVVSNKEIFVGDYLQSRRDCFFQLLGNFGAFANEDLTNETQLCLLSNKTYELLKTKQKDSVVNKIQDFYDKQPGPPYIFDFEYMSEQDFLDFVKMRCEKTPDESTITLYNLYVENTKDS